MNDLKETLHTYLNDGINVAVTINCYIPHLTLRIIDSRQMILYGIGVDGQQGFTLHITIHKSSGKGKKITTSLNRINFLTDFKIYEGRAMIYIKDFGRDINGIITATQTVLNNLRDPASEQTYDLIVNRPYGYFDIQ